MIRITRAPCPSILAAPVDGRRYNSEEVVTVLWHMQKEKCCYCEFKIAGEGHSRAVEHFHPQSKFTSLENDWKNLLMACAHCNGKKSDKFPNAPLPVGLASSADVPKVVLLTGEIKARVLLDPSDPHDVDPEDHIEFGVDDACADYCVPREKNQSARGRATIEVVGLDRSHYVMLRRRHLRVIRNIYEGLLLAEDDNNPDGIRLFRDQLRLQCQPTAQFSALARAYCQLKGIEGRYAKY